MCECVGVFMHALRVWKLSFLCRERAACCPTERAVQTSPTPSSQDCPLIWCLLIKLLKLLKHFSFLLPWRRSLCDCILYPQGKFNAQSSSIEGGVPCPHAWMPPFALCANSERAVGTRLSRGLFQSRETQTHWKDEQRGRGSYSEWGKY